MVGIVPASVEQSVFFLNSSNVLKEAGSLGISGLENVGFLRKSLFIRFYVFSFF